MLPLYSYPSIVPIPTAVKFNTDGTKMLVTVQAIVMCMSMH